MYFLTDFHSVPLPTADTLLFWGFIISSGFLVAQLSTKLSERFAQNQTDETEDVSPANEAGKADQENEDSEEEQ